MNDKLELKKYFEQSPGHMSFYYFDPEKDAFRLFSSGRESYLYPFNLETTVYLEQVNRRHIGLPPLLGDRFVKIPTLAVIDENIRRYEKPRICGTDESIQYLNPEVVEPHIISETNYNGLGVHPNLDFGF